ncbi:MAG: histidine kinase [Eubacteriales bacterium]
MRKSISITKYFVMYFAIILFVVLLGLGVFGYYTLSTYQKQLDFRNNASLDVYTNELVYMMDDLVSFTQDTYFDNYDFRLLSLHSLPSHQEVLLKYNLREIIKNRVPSSGIIMIFDESNSISMYKFGAKNSAAQDTLKNANLITTLKEYCKKAPDSFFSSWQLYSENENAILLYTSKLNDLYICSAIDLKYLSSTGNESSDQYFPQFAFYDENRVLTNTEYIEENSISMEEITQPKHGVVSLLISKFVIQSREIADCGINVCIIISQQNILIYSRLSAILLAFILVVICGFILLIYTLISKILIYPLNQIANASELLSSQPQGTYVVDNSNISELQTINEALNDLIDQKVHLQIENINKDKEKEHAMLQYFQLQTRSHFFLNCLKSLYNMLENTEYEKMRLMILSFSNHLRYIFHDNMTLVSLKSELDEVNDYYHIVLLDRVKPFLVTQNIDPELLSCQIPPLIIQTFLENSYKYGGKSNNILRFDINIDKVIIEDKPFIRIRLSDNGIGYSKEMLEILNAEDDYAFEEYHVGISNLKHRIRLIYKKDYEATFFNKPTGGASALFHLPM